MPPKKRDHESREARERRRAAERARSEARRRSEPPEKIEERRAAARERERARRAGESQEEADERRAATRERNKAKRLSDSQDVSQARLVIGKTRRPEEPPPEEFKPSAPLPQQILESEKLLYLANGMQKPDFEKCVERNKDFTDDAWRETLSQIKVVTCAACGILVVSKNPKEYRSVTNAVREVFVVPPEAIPNHSSRGILDHGDRVSLLKKHCNNGHFYVCEECKRAIETKKTRPAWRMDLGDASALPVLSSAEKASIAIVRVYGRLIKVSADAGVHDPLSLSGHVINFPQSAGRAAGELFPRTDIDAAVRVHFVGGSSTWERMMPLLRVQGGPLEIRPAVVFAWLRRLKETHPLYQTIEIDESEDCVRRMEEAVQRVLDTALVSADKQSAAIDAAARSDIAAVADTVGFGECVVQNQDPRTILTEKIGQIKSFLQVSASTAPLNEFEDNEAILTGAFPWIFMFRLGNERGDETHHCSPE